LVLPREFFESADNLALLESAANGDIKAIDLLGVSVAQTQLQMAKFNDEVYKALTDSEYEGKLNPISLD
jgi:hypothetical protein